jgi:hypothetical protein
LDFARCFTCPNVKKLNFFKQSIFYGIKQNFVAHFRAAIVDSTGMSTRKFLCAVLLFAMLSLAYAGPISYGICQAGCAALVVACYSAAGFVFGATAGLGAPPAILACNAAFGVCQAHCALAFIAPIP